MEDKYMVFKYIDNGNLKAIREFNSIHELVTYNKKGKTSKSFLGLESSLQVGRKQFTGTENYEEAENLLLHGWEHGTKRLSNVKAKTQVSTKYKTVYSMQGYQACVPRYLQGMPDSMVTKKPIASKNKVITINKNIGYTANITTEQIIKESEKVLNLVKALESKGYRVNLYAVSYCKEGLGEERNLLRVKIKQSSQPLNLKQVSFPLVNPSMLRRIVFRVREISEEYDTTSFAFSHGSSVKDADSLLSGYLKGEYFIPSIIKEEEITDIDKYMM